MKDGDLIKNITFEGLVKRLSPTIKRITHRLNGHHTFFDDEDLFQEALSHLWTDYRQGCLEDKTDSYILQGCYFYLKNYIRKNRDNVTILSFNNPVGEDGKSLEEFLTTENSDFFENLEGNMEIEITENNYLNEREKKILHFLLEGMSMREIGAKLGISHVMVMKIKNKIKNRYSEFYQDIKGIKPDCKTKISQGLLVRYS